MEAASRTAAILWENLLGIAGSQEIGIALSFAGSSDKYLETPFRVPHFTSSVSFTRRSGKRWLCSAHIQPGLLIPRFWERGVHPQK